MEGPFVIIRLGDLYVFYFTGARADGLLHIARSAPYVRDGVVYGADERDRREWISVSAAEAMALGALVKGLAPYVQRQRAQREAK